MAAPTVGVGAAYPYEGSPHRTFYQGGKTGGTDGTYNILDTISAASDFIITKFAISIYDPTAGATLQLKVKNTVMANFSGATQGTYIMDLHPGVKFTGADTKTCELIVTGNTAGATSFVMGYFD